MRDLKVKFKSIYPKMAGVAIRYGIPNSFLQDQFIKYNKLNIDDFKVKMITHWALSKKDPIKETSDNIFINAINKLNSIERLVYNMRCIDSFTDNEISKILKIKHEIINKTYNNAKNKLKKDEKITNYVNNVVNDNSECTVPI